MIQSLLSQMTLREKIGQTAMPGPGVVLQGVKDYGGYGEFFNEYPYTGMYISKPCMYDADGHAFASPAPAGAFFV